MPKITHNFVLALQHWFNRNIDCFRDALQHLQVVHDQAHNELLNKFEESDEVKEEVEKRVQSIKT